MNTQHITIYTTATCQQCRLTETHMAAKGLTFTIIHLENEPTIAHQLKTQGYLQAPIVHITGNHPQTWTGFRPDLIDHLAANQ